MGLLDNYPRISYSTREILMIWKLERNYKVKIVMCRKETKGLNNTKGEEILVHSS